MPGTVPGQLRVFDPTLLDFHSKNGPNKYSWGEGVDILSSEPLFVRIKEISNAFSSKSSKDKEENPLT